MIFTGYQKGINLGGWLSQSNENTREYYDSFITARDIAEIAAMGADHVRLPVDYFVIETEDGEPAEEGMAYIDRAVRWCRDNGLHMVLDLHKTYGYSFDPLDTEGDKERFFTDRSLQERFFRLWDRLALRYAEDTDIVSFELLNEIVSPAVWKDWNAVAAEAVKVIRKRCPEAWIIIGGVCYNSVISVPQLDEPADDHIVYNFHCYEPLLFTHQKAYWVDGMPDDLDVSYPDTIGYYREMTGAIFGDNNAALTGGINTPGLNSTDMIGEGFFELLFTPAIRKARETGAPLYCGEYGVIDRAPAADALRWLRDIHEVFERHGIGRSLWTYKDKDFGLVDEHFAPVREEMARLL